MGPHLANSRRDIVCIQATGQDDWLGGIFRHQRPIERSARTTRHALDEGIQQNTLRTSVGRHGGRHILTRANPQRLDIGAAMAFTVGRRLITVKLQQIQRQALQQLLQLVARHVDEQPNTGHERR